MEETSNLSAMKYIARYLKPFKLQVVVGPVAKMIEAIIEVLTPTLMGFLIDAVISGQRELSFFIQYGVLFLILQIVAAAFSFLCQYMASVASQGVGTHIRHDVFEKVQELSFRQLDKFGAVSLSNRLTFDINNIQIAVAMFIRLFFRTPLLIIGSTMAALIISPKTLFVFIPVIVLIFIIMYIIASRTLPLQEEAQVGTDNLGNLVQDYLTGVRIIRAFNKSEHERDYFERKSGEVNEKLVLGSRWSAFLSPGSTFVINIAAIIVLFVAGDMIQVGDLSSGQLIALINYLNLVIQAITVLSNLLLQIPRTLTSSGRLREVLTTEPEIVQLSQAKVDEANALNRVKYSAEYPSMELVSPDIRADSVITLNDVYFRYSATANYVIEDVSLSIERGKRLGVMGTTGSGKTTLARAMQRFYDPVYGEVYLFDQDIRTLTREEIMQHIAYIPQKADLFTGTIRDNLLMGVSAKQAELLGEDELEARMWQALETAQAKDFVSVLDKQLDARVERSGRNFSGGQRQRLCIARALVTQSPLIIFDDSASALDYGTESRLNHALAELEWKPAQVVVSQRVRSMIAVDEIILLDTGRVSARGTHEELLETSELYREIYASQEQAN